MAECYGADFRVTKFEDKNHVGKRLKYQLEKLHGTWKKSSTENNKVLNRLSAGNIKRLCQAVTTNLNRYLSSSSNRDDA